MINLINAWAQKIIVVIIICAIMEMILPEGKNKKYIKMVMGVYVTFTIISPMISQMNNIKNGYSKKINFSSGRKLSIETSANIDTSEYIEAVYIEKLKANIVAKVKEMGYEVLSVGIDIETNDEEKYGEILNISVVVSVESNNNEDKIKIDKITIGDDKIVPDTTISENEKESLKKYLASIYGLSENKISIK